MSIKEIRGALEAELATLAGTVPIAWENVAYRPTVGKPFLRATLLPAQTQNPSFGGVHNRETGIFQVDVYMPTGGGSAAAAAWAETIRSGFARGTVFTSGAITVRILQEPSIAPALAGSDWFTIPVSVPYLADVFQ